MNQPILLSPPHLSGEERRHVDDAIASNWIAPVGPHVDRFERAMASLLGVPDALATVSGTAALHLALRAVGVSTDDEVLVSTFTFIASVTPILWLGAKPTLVDSERRSWNLDPNLVEDVLTRRARLGRAPKALVAVHLYGQTADLTAISDLCDRFGVTLVEDAAEALGATHGDRPAGTLGAVGIYSFNGNKIITTSGGGMLVSPDHGLVSRARKLATQAREPAAHYEHAELGYNYRLRNVLGALGLGQLEVLEDRVAARRRNFERYRARLGDLAGVEWMPDAGWGRHTRWLTTITIDPVRFGATRDQVLAALEADRIEARPLWKPMHLQPALRDAWVAGGAVAEELFDRGLCLPSGSSLTTDQIDRVAESIARMARIDTQRPAALAS